MTCQIRRWLSALLLLAAVVLAMLIALGVLPLSNAAAAIRQLEESPGQMVYQSFHSPLPNCRMAGDREWMSGWMVMSGK